MFPLNERPLPKQQPSSVLWIGRELVNKGCHESPKRKWKRALTPCWWRNSGQKAAPVSQDENSTLGNICQSSHLTNICLNIRVMSLLHSRVPSIALLKDGVASTPRPQEEGQWNTSP